MEENENTCTISTVTPPILFKIILFIILAIIGIIIWFSSLFIFDGPDGSLSGSQVLLIFVVIGTPLLILFSKITKLRYVFKHDCIQKTNYKGEVLTIPYAEILEARPKNTILSAISFAHLEIIFKSGDDTHVTNIYFLDNPDYYRSLIFGGLSNSDNGFIV